MPAYFELLQTLQDQISKRMDMVDIRDFKAWREAEKEYFHQVNALLSALESASSTEQHQYLSELKEIGRSTQDEVYRDAIRQLRDEADIDLKFRALRIMNLRFYHRTSRYIINRIKGIEYSLRAEEEHCNCRLKQELLLKLLEKPHKQLIFIRVIDPYHDCDLYQCEACSTYWIWDPYSDDGGTQGWRAPSGPSELRQIQELDPR